MTKGIVALLLTVTAVVISATAGLVCFASVAGAGYPQLARVIAAAVFLVFLALAGIDGRKLWRAID